jgi:hypothetical protein
MRCAPHVMCAHAIKRASPPKEVQQRHNNTMHGTQKVFSAERASRNTTRARKLLWGLKSVDNHRTSAYS